MAAKNDITGDSIISRHSKAYEENMEKIFGDKSAEKERKAKEKAEYFARLEAETKARLEAANADNKDTRYNQETQEVLKYNN